MDKTQLFAFFRLSRLHFLAMPLFPYLIGVGVAQHHLGRVDVPRAAWGLVVQLFVQLSIAYLNDYWDVETDRINQHRTPYSGGSGELAKGTLPRWVGLAAGLATQGVALGIALSMGLSWFEWGLLGLCLLICHIYTAPPIQLVYQGWGEVSAAFTAAILVPSWAYTLQTGTIHGDIGSIGLGLLPLVTSVMLTFAVPDYQADQQVGKRTLPVLVGLEQVPRLYGVLLAVGYALLGATALQVKVLHPFIWVPLVLSMPLVMWSVREFYTPIRQSAPGWRRLVMVPTLPATVMVIAVMVGVWL